MAHIHLTWELGGGLGHAGRLKPLAEALRAQGHRVTMSLRDLVHTHSVLADLDVPQYQAPVWLHRTLGLPPTQGNLAEVLITAGYLKSSSVTALVGGWRTLFEVLKPDLLVADYAPTALLAARSMGLRSCALGSGYFVPPPGKALPLMRDFEPIPPGRLAGAEAHVLGIANTILAAHGAPALAHAADVWRGDQSLLCSWPELVPHAASYPPNTHWFGPNFNSQGGEPPHWPAADSAGQAKVFAYLRAEHPDHLQLLQTLAAQACRTLCFMPEVVAGKPPPLVHPHIHYSAGPVDLAVAMQSSALCIHHGGQGVLAQALLAGVPQLVLPMQGEQLLNARCLEALGAGLNAAAKKRPVNWASLIQALLTEPRFQQSAQAFAARYAGFSQTAQVQALVAAVEAALENAAGEKP